MDDDRVTRHLGVVADAATGLDREELAVRRAGRHGHEPRVGGGGLREALERHRGRSTERHGDLAGRRDPAQQVLVVGDRVLAGAAVGRVFWRAAVAILAHHVPRVVVRVRRAVRRMRQAEAVPHLVRDDRDVGVGPRRFPGHGPHTAHAVERGVERPAPRRAVEVAVEHHVDALERPEVDRRRGRAGAVVEEPVEVRVDVAVAILVVDVEAPDTRQHEPAEGLAARDVGGVVRLLTPVVVETWRRARVHAREERQRARLGSDVGELARDGHPGMRTRDAGLRIERHVGQRPGRRNTCGRRQGAQAGRMGDTGRGPGRQRGGGRCRERHLHAAPVEPPESAQRLGQGHGNIETRHPSPVVGEQRHELGTRGVAGGILARLGHLAVGPHHRQPARDGLLGHLRLRGHLGSQDCDERQQPAHRCARHPRAMPRSGHDGEGDGGRHHWAGRTTPPTESNSCAVTRRTTLHRSGRPGGRAHAACDTIEASLTHLWQASPGVQREPSGST